MRNRREWVYRIFYPIPPLLFHWRFQNELRTNNAFDNTLDFLTDRWEGEMNKTTWEIYLNCKEQELLDYVIEAYKIITIHNLEVKNE